MEFQVLFVKVEKSFLERLQLLVASSFKIVIVR